MDKISTDSKNKMNLKHIMLSILILWIIREVIYYLPANLNRGYLSIPFDVRHFFLGLFLVIIPTELLSEKAYKIIRTKKWIKPKLYFLLSFLSVVICSLISLASIYGIYYRSSTLPEYQAATGLCLYVLWMFVTIRMGRLYGKNNCVNAIANVVILLILLNVVANAAPVLPCIACAVAAVVAGAIIIYKNSKSLFDLILMIITCVITVSVLIISNYYSQIIFVNSKGYYFDPVPASEVCGVVSVIFTFVITLAILALAGYGSKIMAAYSKSKSEEAVALIVVMSAMMLGQIVEDIWYNHFLISRPLFNEANIIWIMLLLRTLWMPKSFANRRKIIDRDFKAGVVYLYINKHVDKSLLKLIQNEKIMDIFRWLKEILDKAEIDDWIIENADELYEALPDIPLCDDNQNYSKNKLSAEQDDNGILDSIDTERK